jgi:hypothetical protein
LLVLLVAVAGCGPEGRHRSAPSAPSAQRTQPPADADASGTLTGSRAGQPTLPPEHRTLDGSSLVAFPPRDESFEFRNDLEVKYRDGLHRGAGSTFVDREGDVVWIQEYLRYRVNGCLHADAQQKVLDQIDGRPAAPVCGNLSPGVVAFPPRDESFMFRLALETKYRDGLRRGPVSTFVDIEGSLVWVQEYLRYRVNRCGHVASMRKVFDQIDGRGIAPICGEAGSLSGLWFGSSTYFNAPFTMDLFQSGTMVSGKYRDQHDAGTASATFAGSGPVVIDVNFGDTGIRFTGTLDGPDRIVGTISGPVIGGTFPFEMVR